MGLLTKAKLDDLLGAGCSACGGNKLAFQMYVAGCFPLMEGEPIGRVAWSYDGEAFVDGVYRVTCADCQHEILSEDVCPRCHAAGGLAKALSTPTAYPVPAGCPRCEGQEVRYYAMVPAKTVYSGGRAEKARTHVELLDDGFHGYRASCKTCKDFAVLSGHCPLCEAPGPLREVPK
jgi:hypothetical protein